MTQSRKLLTYFFSFGAFAALATLLTHHVVYHVDFHGATSHVDNHVVKLDKLNHDKNHVVIHVVFYNANQTSSNIELNRKYLNRKSNQIAESVRS